MDDQNTIRAAEALFPALLRVARQAAPAWRRAREGEPPDEPWATPPDDDRRVLVFRNGHVDIGDVKGRKGGAWGLELGWYDHDRGYWRVHGRPDDDVTHWMELPADPPRVVATSPDIEPTDDLDSETSDRGAA